MIGSDPVDRPRLRIWHIAELYPPHYGGGAAIYVRDVCRFLAGRGHEVRVLCTEAIDGPDYSVRTDSDGPVRIDRLNLPYLRSQDPGGWFLGIRSWRRHCARAEQAVEALLGDWKPDVVNFHTPYSLYEEALPLLRRRGVPIVGMAHCAWLICPRLRLMRSPTSTRCTGPGPAKCLECLYSHWDGSHGRAALKLPWRILKLGAYPAYRLASRYRSRQDVDGLIAYSEFMRAAHDGHIPGPVIHVPLGLDLADRPSEVPVRPRHPVRFGFAGGFQAHKGIAQLLDAAASLRKRGLAFELHVWGPNEESGRREIATRQLEDRVVVRGLFAPQDRWAAFAEFDVLLMATQDEEPFGRVIQEAAAAGAPSIAPDVGGISEQIRDGVDGLLYRFRDQADLERQMTRIVEEPRLVAELARNLRPVVDTRRAVQDVERFYLDVIARRALVSATMAGDPVPRGGPA
jgi:glycosyltransferase involved in cell wall biosynthesis